MEKQKNRTVYKIVYSDVTEKPETQFCARKDWSGREDLNLRPLVPNQILHVMEIY